MRASADRKLTDSIQRKLELYAMAASAAGVGLMALSSTAEAKIVYTPTHVVLPFGLTPVDFNHDGVTDLALSKSYWNTSDELGTTLDVSHTPKVAWALGHGMRGVGELKAGFVIGGARFSSDSALMAGVFSLGRGFFSYAGEWAQDGKGFKNRYLGVRFLIDSKVHYGWVRLSVSFSDHHLRGVMTGYAYETIANKSIIAGATKEAVEDENLTPAALENQPNKPATLGALALGAPGLSIWRRDESGTN